MAYSLYAVGGSLWHNLVVCVTENDYSQTINLHSIMKKISACCALRDYVRPSLEVVCVASPSRTIGVRDIPTRIEMDISQSTMVKSM